MSVEMAGRRFGLYQVVARSQSTSNRGDRWLCKCECGTERVVHGASLRRGQSQSCGCTRGRLTAARHTTHGQTIGGKSSRAFSIWAAMIARCTNPRGKNYKYYGEQPTGSIHA